MKYIHSDNPINDLTFSLDKFQSPSVQFFSAYAWCWGTPVDKKEIERQLDEFYSCNIKKLYIIPEPKDFRPSYSMEPDYLTEEYFKLFSYAYEYAEKKGMELWLYDEGGWPSGSACGRVLKSKPHLESKQLNVRTVSSPYVPSENAVAAFSDGKRISPGYFSDKPITEYYMKFRGLNYPNISDSEATDTFISLTHEEYKKHIGHMFGKSVTAVFTDEPVTERTGWFDGFEKKFKERYGYDMLDFLPVIYKDLEEDVTEEEKKIRIDYLDLLGEVFAENFFLKNRAWCHKNNLLFTGHLDDEDATFLPNQRFYSVLRQMRCFDMPGIDVIWRQIFPGEKNHFFPRFASSAANQTGNPYAISESFAVYGSGLTFNEMRYILLYQITRGINTFNFNSISFSYDGLERKDARPGFMPLLPTWHHLKEFNNYTARISYLASLGLPGITYAVYMPLHSFWSGGKEAQEAAAGFDRIVYTLEKKHCPVDFIDDDFLATAVIKNNAICTGSAAYSTIIMQNDIKISENSKKKLSEFKKAGGKVIFENELDKVESAADITSENISLFKRKLDNGTLFILQNESIGDEVFSVSFFEKGNIYEIDAARSEIFIAELENICLKSGEERIFLITDEVYSAKERKNHIKGSIIIDKFSIKRNWAFVIGEEVFEKHTFNEDFSPTKPVDWCKLYGDNFSGEVTYKVEFDFDQVPESIEIDLGKVNYSCDLVLNGKSIGTLCFAPFKVTVEKDMLQKHNELLVRVANTHANQYVTTTAFDSIPENIIGPYHSIAKQFESESLESGLMTPIIINY